MKFRTDIQALRGLGVLLVVLHHAGVGPFHGGYLGVDIFFVVSGYLITGLVKQGMEDGSFSFTRFYMRRAKRLLPAAYVTFLATGLLAPFFLASAELNDLARQVFGAVTFSANIALLLQTDYFSGAANLKPLLHIWSLSLEEQYYLVLPALLFFVPRRHWSLTVSALFTLSLALCLTLVTVKPSATFYLLPTRAWELGLGSMAALGLMNGHRAQAAVSWLFWPSVLLLVVIPMAPISAVHPGVDALVVCLATLLIILKRDAQFGRFPATRALAKVGDFSYSLYLVHWPIFAFLNNAHLDKPTLDLRLYCICAAFVLGYLLYVYVENPFRSTAKPVSAPRLTGTAVGMSAVLVALSTGIAHGSVSRGDYAHLLRPNFGLDKSCTEGGRFDARRECMTSDTPRLLVWGDSFAMHVVPGIAETAGPGVVQATRPVCGPMLDLAPFNNVNQNETWVKECLAFNESVIEYLSKTPTIDTVVIASLFGQYLGVSYGEQSWIAGTIVNGRVVGQPPNVALVKQSMATTVARVRALGKRVVVIAPPPSSGPNVGRCLERVATGKISLGMNARCEMPVADVQRHQAPILELLKQLPAAADVAVFDFNSVLCSTQTCVSQLDGTFLYRDEHHLSYDGSRLLAKKLDLGNTLRAMAR
ncbi:acyltransferase family protein [Sphaerotilaceae bacterium SBD11-9]